MTYGEPDTKQVAVLRKRHPEGRVARKGRIMRPSHLWAAAAVVLGVTVAGCSGGSTPPTAASAGGSGSSGASSLAQAVTYSQCIRSHGVSNFPDPVQTPSGGYGYRTSGIDPNSAAFQGAIQACKALPSPWTSTGQELTPA